MSRPVRIAPFPAKGNLGELALVAARALAFLPPLWPRSVLGPLSRWRPGDELSEFAIVNLRRPARSLEWWSRVLIPAAKGEPPRRLASVLPRPLLDLFWRSTTLFDHPEGAQSAFPHERWFFINGIVTNEALARINAELVHRLFGRPLRVVQNATHSLALDVYETAIGKEFKTDPDHCDRGTFTEPGLEATIAVLEALAEPEVERVVVIAHSQGTVIAANVLRAISKALELWTAGKRPVEWMRAHRAAIELTCRPGAIRGAQRRRLAAALEAFLCLPEHGLGALERLEIYTFANCADRMKYVAERGDRRLPRLEHFANERDVVARLGVLSPCREAGDPIDIDGPLFVRPATRWPGDGWGHFLNDAYLFAIRDHLTAPAGRRPPNPYRPTGSAPAEPRLYGYFGGARPED